MPTRIAINGFGRIGRASFKIALDRDDCEIVAINDLTDPKSLAHALKYDSAYGVYKKEVSHEGNFLVVDGQKFKILSEKEPAKLPWKELKIDVVLECTGRFTKDNAAKAHLEAGALRVVVSAPTKGDQNDIQTFLKGVNHDQYLGQNSLANASCTTNCVAPITHVLHKEFEILKAGMTTVHAVTVSQNLVDGFSSSEDKRRARSGMVNIVPTTTGAAKATTKAVTELEGKFDGIAVRVPVIVGSLTDLTAVIKKKTTVEEVNKAYVKASKNPFYKGVLEVTNEPIVSTDIIGNPHSAIVDLGMTRVIDEDLVKVLAWYDNEWGYSHRLVEMALVAVG
jgi:glyceraldehyde 3-phosphate dehydrogenase